MSKLPHGGRLDAAIAQFGGERHQWLDLSTGINPIAYPIGVLEEEVWQRLPDEGLQQSLDQAARNYYRVPDDARVIAANGTQSIIQMLPTILTKKNVAIVSPTYNEHAACWRQAGHVVAGINNPQDAGDADVLVVVNPNNPDARVWEPSELEAIAAKLGERGGMLVVDEAFADSAPETSLVPNLPGNCIILRSFGKFFGLAGLRLGFAICRGEIADRLQQNFGPWNVSGPALVLGARALNDRGWIEKARRFQQSMGQNMADMFDDVGLEVRGCNGLFLFTHHTDSTRMAQALGARRILVREFAEMPQYLRFGLCPDERSFDRLEDELRSILA